ncbi:MAG: hypothetical protein P8I25_00080, partial [Ilumatobacter sp.]|nr:hypothetical protein [Ilumatobacter sp.]
GLGLQLAAAMWLETPVIASRYSGNLDFMSDKTAGLIDVTLIDVEHGEGAYPDGFQWADPDLGQAAAWMKRMVNESGCRQQLREAALRYMREQPAEEWFGQNYSRTLDFTPQPGR